MKNNIIVWKISPDIGYSPKKINLSYEPKSLDEGTRLLPSGGYTTLRTFESNLVIKLDNHFQRLEETSELTGNPIKLDYNLLREGLRTILHDYVPIEKRIRIILDLEQEPGTIYILVEGLITPTKIDFNNGVKVITRQMHRQNPKAKLTNFISEATTVRNETTNSVTNIINEVIMVSENGKLLEGLSSNFFGVLHGSVRTSDEGILQGITRSMVMEIIYDLKIPIEMTSISVNDLKFLDEAFITSTSRSVLPVTEIDGLNVNNGLPGKMTLAILEEYRKRIRSLVEEV